MELTHIATLLRSNITESEFNLVSPILGLIPLRAYHDVDFTPDELLRVRPHKMFLGKLKIPYTEKHNLKSYAEAIIEQRRADFTMMAVLNPIYKGAKDLLPFDYEKAGRIQVGTDYSFDDKRLGIIDGNKRALVWAVEYLRGNLSDARIPVRQQTHLSNIVHGRDTPADIQFHLKHTLADGTFDYSEVYDSFLTRQGALEMRLSEVLKVEPKTQYYEAILSRDEFLNLWTFPPQGMPALTLSNKAQKIINDGGITNILRAYPNERGLARIHHEMQTFDYDRFRDLSLRSLAGHQNVFLEPTMKHPKYSYENAIALAVLLLQSNFAYQPIRAMFRYEHKNEPKGQDFSMSVLVKYVQDPSLFLGFYGDMFVFAKREGNQL